MKITSPAFGNEQKIPSKYTCMGDNINPPVSISDVPYNTQSLVLVVRDMDAKPKAWIHWLLYNMLPTTTEIEEDTVPQGATEGICNGGTYGYEGPCHKYFNGRHFYHFTVYALDAVLEASDDADFEEVSYSMTGHIISEATLIGYADGTGEEV